MKAAAVTDTVYMDAALKQLRAEDFDGRAEDAAPLSQLRFDDNMLSRYAFILPQEIARGKKFGRFASPSSWTTRARCCSSRSLRQTFMAESWPAR